MLESVVAQSSQTGLVAPGSFDFDVKIDTFKVYGKLADQPNEATITISGVHRETFYQGLAGFTVTFH